MKIEPQFLAAGCPILASNLQVLAQNGDSPFANLGYEPDNWKAYIEFEICHALPVVAGPVQSGNFIGYQPPTLAASAQSLVHQQFNIRHMIKAYSKDTIPRDRIIGCVVATYFPRSPVGSWPSVSADKDSAPAIRACAVVFKLAEGVNSLLGQHLTSRQTQSVSIEATTGLDNIGLWLPSAPELVTPIADAEGELAKACTFKEGKLQVGKVKGEQAVMIYGLDGHPIQFRGVGMTANPAEREAKILSVAAERMAQGFDGDLLAVAAEQSDVNALVGRTVRFGTGRSGNILSVHQEGRPLCGGVRMSASAECPVLEIALPDGRRVLRRLSELSENIL